MKKLKNNKTKKITNKSSVFSSDRRGVQNNQIKILLSAEHRNYVEDIAKCFDFLNIKVEAGYVRKSVEELPMQVLIFLTGAISGGLTWDLIKIGIKRVLKKFKKAGIRITDRNQNTYNISPEGQMNIFLIPNGKMKVISNITSIDDLFKHLQNQNTGWRKVKFGDLINLIGGGTPKTSVKEYWSGGIPWLSVTDFNTGRKYVYSSEKSITETGLNNSNTKILNKGDIIISARGTVGVISMLGEKMAFNQSCYGIRAKDESFNEYVYYLLKNTVNRLQHISHGGVFDTITRDTFNKIEVSLPPLSEQEAIAEVLSSLDDKIELLHKQNKTLENIAQTFFHKWFIEDAKEDWEEKSLDKIADYLNGLACQKYPPKNEIDKLPVLKIKELRNGFTKNSDWSNSEVEDKYIVELGDIIFSWSGSLLLKIWDGQKCVLNQHLFKITSKQYPKWFYYFWTKYYMEKFVGIADSKATTMGHIKREDLSNSVVLLSSKNELSKMNKLINPHFEKIISNLKSISKLEKLRNTLLPKLMNGNVRINL